MRELKWLVIISKTLLIYLINVYDEINENSEILSIKKSNRQVSLTKTISLAHITPPTHQKITTEGMLQ
jgi:hypothetical protein